MQTLLHIQGPKAVGKTTITQLFMAQVAFTTMLVVDASANRQLTKLLVGDSNPSLSQLITESLDKTHSLSRETLDWVFSDLPSSVNPSTDILTVGPLPNALPPEILQPVATGLKRLFQQYEAVLIDDTQPGFLALVGNFRPTSILVLTPQSCDVLPQWVQSPIAPMTILNEASEGPVPAVLHQALEAHDLTLIGKIPYYADETQMTDAMPGAFRNCLLRMDVPYKPI